MDEFGAVITADIVNSSGLNRKDFSVLSNKLKILLKAEKLKNVFYRGDSFQLLCNPEQAFILAIKLRALTRSGEFVNKMGPTDIRIAIGLGKVKKRVRSLATAMGEAFQLSGRALDNMGKAGKRLAVRINDEKLAPGMEAVALIGDTVMQKISPKQAEVLFELLNGSTEIEVAAKLAKSQSTINKLKQASGWNEMEQAIRIYDSMIVSFHNA